MVAPKRALTASRAICRPSTTTLLPPTTTSRKGMALAAKIALSDAPFATLAEEYLLEHEGVARHLALEVSRALQFFFTSTQFTQVNHIVLAGGCAILPGADEAVASRTQVNTIIANPFADMVLSDRVRANQLLADASSLMVACGLALRRFDE